MIVLAILRAFFATALRQLDVILAAALALVGIALKFSVPDALIVAGVVLFIFAVFGGRISKWGS